MTIAQGSPFFSVVIPVHNRLELLERAVTSVLGQTLLDYEITVVDDGSNDGKISGLVALRDSKVKLIQQQHLGVSHARNTGIAHSGGKWIAFLDSDDVWKNSHLEELMALIHSFPNAGMVATSIVEIADDEWSFRWPGPVRRQPEIVDYFRKSAKRKGTVHSSSVAIQRAVVEAVGKFTPVLAGEDLEYWARVALVTPVAKSHQVTAAYLRSNGGTMELIANGGEAAAKPAPRTVEDLSPSIKFLWRSLQSDKTGICSQDSLKKYIDGGVDSSVLFSIVSNNLAQIDALRKLYVTPWFRHASLIRILAMAPKWVHLTIHLMYKIGQVVKRRLKT